MPALPWTLPLSTLIDQNAVNNLTLSSRALNGTNNGLHVVCAWPVSGQYGPGSRVLYYVLVAACVFAQKIDLLRNACLAAALLFPAVAAIHGIVLAALHVNGAVDMDVFGAFQLMAIGILAAPATVRLSSTYFNNPGRNMIFLWTGLILAGLLSLTVEFYRIKPSPCEESGNSIPLSLTGFQYGNTTCGLTCSVDQGPFSPMRRGSGNNIYVIPAPDKLTFGTATLLAAACCVPAILSLIFMWDKILKINRKPRPAPASEDDSTRPSNGDTHNATGGYNSTIIASLKSIEYIVFSAAVFAILIIGERNLFSEQVRYQTEPIASIGQWAPIVGTGLAVLGSLYVFLAGKVDEINKRKAREDPIKPPSNSSRHSSEGEPQIMIRVETVQAPGFRETRANDGETPDRSSQEFQGPEGFRGRVFQTLATMSDYLGTNAQQEVPDDDKRAEFPVIPAEDLRNPDLDRFREQWIGPAELHRQRSSGSFISNVSSDAGVEGSSSRPRASSNRSRQSEHSLPASPSSITPHRRHESASSANHPSFELQKRDTLEVPQMVHHR